MQERTLDISWGTIAKLSLAALLIYVIFLTKDILVWLLFGVIISIIFDPVIDALERFRIPRVVATLGLYFLVFGVIAFIIYGTAPLFINEIKRFPSVNDVIGGYLYGATILLVAYLLHRCDRGSQETNSESAAR